MSNECHHAFGLFLLGSETPVWRRELEDNAQHVGLSFYSALARMPKSKAWLLENLYDDKCEILVDAGAFSTSKRPITDHQAYHEKYSAWVSQNIERISLVLEYDPLRASLDDIKRWRTEFWDKIPQEKFVPIWHEEHGPEALEELCIHYPRVGLKKPPVTLEGQLRGLVAAHGTRLHGIGINDPADMARLPLASVSSMTWLAPSRTSTLQVWAQNRMQIYTGKEVPNALARHERDIRAAGFDPAGMVGAERRELTRYTIWAWSQFERDLMGKRERTGGGVITAITNGAGSHTNGKATPPSTNGGAFRAIHPAVRTERKTFPGMALHQKKVLVNEGEEERHVTVPVLQESGLRVCDSCYLAGRCPEYTPGSKCAYNFPVEINTKEALMSSMTSIVGVQFARVMFARSGEEADGSLADPVVSAEMDRYLDMIGKIKEIQEDSSFLEIKVKGAGGQGLLATLMGNVVGAQRGAQAAQAMRPRVDPRRADDYLGGIIDVEE